MEMRVASREMGESMKQGPESMDKFSMGCLDICNNFLIKTVSFR